MTDTSRHEHERDDLVTALVDLRDAITPLVDDMLCGIRPSVERWLAFADVISRVVETCRQEVVVVARGSIQAPPCTPPR